MQNINRIMGSQSPRERKTLVGNHLIILWLFLVVEIMFFSGLISSFLVTRLKHIVWPPEGQFRLPIYLTAFNSLILLSSALSMFQVYIALKKKDNYALTLKYFLLTSILGSLFFIIQGYEWISLVKEGLTLNNLGIYASFFYILIGSHAFHVFLGMICLWLYFLLLIKKSNNGLNILMIKEKIPFPYNHKIYLERCFDLVSLYWYFVVMLWPIIYFLAYWL